MANFEVELPDGRKFTVEGAASAQAAAEGIQQMLAQQGGQQGGQQQPAAAQPEQPQRYVDPNASRGMYAVDLTQGLVGSGIEGIGNFIKQAVPTVGGPMAEYGRSVAEENEADIARRGYQSTYKGNVSDQSLDTILPFVAEKMIEHSIPTLTTYGGYGAAAVAGALGSVPLAAFFATSATIGTLLYGIGETTDELKSKVSKDDYNANAAVIGGTLVAMLDRVGATKALGIDKSKLMSMSLTEVTAALKKAGKGNILKKILRGMAIEGVTEAAQENVIMGTATTQGADYTFDEILDRNLDSAVIGAAMGGGMTTATEGVAKTARATKQLFSDTGAMEAPENLPDMTQRAAGDFARRLETLAGEGDLFERKFNLQDLDKMSQTGARAAIDAAHKDLVGQITKSQNELKSELKSDYEKDTLEVLLEKVKAQVGLSMAKNKTKSVVTFGNFKALQDLVGGYTEGQTLMNLIREAQIMTDVHNSGYQGDLSKFTDMFRVFGSEIGYDKSAVAVERVVRPIASFAAGSQFYFLPTIAQQAVASIGTRIDKARGTYSKVDKFVQENKQGIGQPAPRPPSVREQRLQQAQQASSTRAGLQAYNDKRDGGENIEGPVGKILVGTGLSPEGLNKLLDYIETAPDTTPDVMEYVDQTRRNLAGEGNRIEDISPWIQAINGTLNQSEELDALREDQPDNPLAQRARRRAGFGPSTDQSTAGTAQQQQTQGRSPAVQQGIDDNRAFNDALQEAVKADPNVTEAEKVYILRALRELRRDLGSEPAVAAMDVVSRLKSDGISESLINRHIMPYVERVLRQQARSGRQQPPSTGNTDLAFDEDFETPRSPSMAQVMHEEMYQSSPKMRARQARELGLDINQKQIRELLKKRGKRRGQDFDYVDPLIEARDTRKSRTPTEIEKLQARQAEIEASRKAMQQKFADERNAEVERYEREKAAREATRDNLLAAARQARKLGRKVRSSSGRDGKISSYYVSALTGPDLRISDHAIPANPRREFMAQENGRSDYNGYYGPELIIDDTTTDAEVLAFLNGTDLAFDEDFDASKPALTDNVPTGAVSGVPLETYLPRAYDIAKREVYKKGRDLKLALQEASLRSQKSNKLNLRGFTPENIDRLADFAVADALEAIKTNSNAIGWYDKTVTEALDQMGQVFPEIKSDGAKKLQFIWALAATSNGLKVDKNLMLAAEAYEHLQTTGRFPTNIGIGESADAINSGLAMYHQMLDFHDGDHSALEAFANSQMLVKDLQKKYKVKISGEGANEMVRGAAVIGPKIGNGFFSNLYGNFDALTIDRWNMRTVGRWRGNLVVLNKKMIKQKRDEMWSTLSALDDNQIVRLKKLYKGFRTKISNTVMSNAALDKLAAATAKASMKPKWRLLINEEFEAVRLLGNALHKYKDGQVEAPSGPTERSHIRRVFEKALDRLNNDAKVRALPAAAGKEQPLTMADLQALLWYPEKLLYDTAKKPVGEESKGYKDDEAPDYANAARKFVNNRRNNSQGSRLGSVGSDGRRGRGTGTPIDGPNGQSIGILQSQQGPDASRQRGVLSQSDVSGQGQGTSATLEELDALREGKSPEALAAFVAKDGWSILTATQEAIGDHDHPQNIAANEDLLSHLEETGVPFIEVTGMYLGTPQGKSFLILSNEDAAVKLGQRFNQDSVLTVRGFVYSDPSTPVTPSTGVITAGPEALKEENYTDVAGQPFAMGLDFGSDSFDQDVGSLTQQPAQQPQQQSSFNMKALVNKMLGRQPPTTEQVKAQLPEVRALFEIGKKGSKYEKGIQNLDDALVLADALGLTVRMFDVQQDMMNAVGVGDRVRGVFRSSTKEVFGLKAGTPSDALGTITDLEALTTILHEIGHGMAAGVGPTEQSTLLQMDNDMNSDATAYVNAANPSSQQRSNIETALSGSFEAAMFPHLAIDYTGRGSKIQQEVINLQENIEVYLDKNISETRKVRKILQLRDQAAKDGSGLARLQFVNHLQYVRGNREFAVDPLWVYMANPKLARAVMPMTTALIKKHFKDAQSTDIQFFTHPLAVSLAVVLAMIANGRAEEEEEERQQMPAGALSPQAGALSQQQFAA